MLKAGPGEREREPNRVLVLVLDSAAQPRKHGHTQATRTIVLRRTGCDLSQGVASIHTGEHEHEHAVYWGRLLRSMVSLCCIRGGRADKEAALTLAAELVQHGLAGGAHILDRLQQRHASPAFAALALGARKQRAQPARGR